ncbi:class I SAM-dependent methyltransferase [Paraflavitalea pollutisoli]|uniref:class I SAM-dependent methyltransferase n=1 Tax=Paraflavitalea pollutisoli TaxID=3034143 RepID=UPI0023EAF3DF|nr:class I SAM-dependent methyltransferase [Paraflavitalea sp. H1-2-19X]
MNIQEAYDAWAGQYDTNVNKTRDLEAVALRTTLAAIPIHHCLEIGCGTGKNTTWYIDKAHTVTAVDQSQGMLDLAREKISSPKVTFVQADIQQPWDFVQQPYDLVGFSLVLEHIEDLHSILEKAAAALQPGGYVYIGELHPFKQYTGSMARFETTQGTQLVTCFNHHISDFVEAGKQSGLSLIDIEEYFDEDDRKGLPRILTLLLKKD